MLVTFCMFQNQVSPVSLIIGKHIHKCGTCVCVFTLIEIPRQTNRARAFESVVVVHSLSCVQLLATTWTAARQAPLSFTVSQSLLRFMSIESVMLSNHLILCCPLLLLPSNFPSIRVFDTESALHIDDQSIGASATTLVLPMSIQCWFPLKLIWSKGL